MEVDFVNIQNLESHESTVPKGNSTPPFQAHGNKGDYFAQKIKKIDKDLRIYDDPSKSVQVKKFKSQRKLLHFLTYRI